MKILKFFMDLQDFLNLSKAVITTFFAFLQIIIFYDVCQSFSLRNAAGYLF
jgi:hypothetical protein